MKSIKLFLAFGLLTLVSCKKTDMLNQETNSNETSTATSYATVVSDWKTISNWSAENSEGSYVNSGKISDSAITSDGLILIYSKNNTSTHTLPYSDGIVHWFYQVQKGSLIIKSISGDEQSASIDKNQSFRYVIISKEQLSELQKIKNDFLNLSYEEAMALFAK